jgi:pre-mRNA-processing factor 17
LFILVYRLFFSLSIVLIILSLFLASNFVLLQLNRKKRFLGHLVAGYSCGLDFSPDGSLLVSGDSEGKLFFWDVVTSKQLRKLQGHAGPVNSVVWHPHQASMVFSGGQDGKILVWD